MKPATRALVLSLLVSLGSLAATAAELAAAVDAELPALLETYKHLHANPEISYLEKETATLVAGRLRELGFEVTEGVGDYGVEGRVSYGLVGVMENGDGPTVMVRTDLDGLPVEEKTGVPWASRAKQTTEEGEEVFTMHACGHDLHMTSFLGTAAMLDDGLYERFPRPEAVLALHTNASLGAGRIGVVPGYALANVDSVDITVRGAGGHGAYPHTTRAPVTLAALIVTNLQTIVSRQVSPLDPAVVTVGSIHGGTKHNIIPDEVELQLTVRSYKPEVRAYLLDSIRRTAEDTARAAGFPEELIPVVGHKEEEFTPSTYNDPALLERLRPVYVEALGEEAVVSMEPVMGGEDFSRYALDGEVPISIFWLGAADPEKVRQATEAGATLPSLHSSTFSPLPGPAIRTGVMAMTSAVLELMGE